ncbi:MAG: glycosyltransferase [Microcoleaceae cyanobacterium]
MTVSNRFLQEKFGGQVVRHAVDTELFNSERYNSEQFRQELGIDLHRKILMFCGTPQVHKGIDDLIDAANLLTDRDDFLLAVVGNKDSGYAKTVTDRAKEMLGEKFREFGLQPFEKIPQFLSLADVIVIPQRKNFSTVGQVPIKVFEGMAMAKPVVSTVVSDIPEILQGCGWTVEPENPPQLAEAIRTVLTDPEAAQAMGQKARQKCIENYSWDAVEQVLQKIIQNIL